MEKTGPTRTGRSLFVLFMANVDVYHAYGPGKSVCGLIIEYIADSCQIYAILSGFPSEKWTKQVRPGLVGPVSSCFD